MMKQVIERELYSVDDCFSISGHSAWWWRRKAYAGEVESVKISAKLMIPASEVRRVIAEGTRPRHSDSVAV